MLNGHRLVNFSVVEAVSKAIRYCSFGEQGCPAFADMFQDGFFSNDVQVGLLLSCEGCGREVFGSGAGADGEGAVLVKVGKMVRDRLCYIVRNGCSFDDRPDVGTDSGNRLPVLCFKMT